MSKLPVKIENKKLPIDNKRGYEVYYDYNKRLTSGGYVNTLILGGIIFTAFMWVMIIISLGSR